MIENEWDEELWEKLRSLRAEIAKESNLPAFVIFHDKTLIELVNRSPRSLNEMKDIYGIGQAKLDNYGQRFLDVILIHIEKNIQNITVDTHSGILEKSEPYGNQLTKNNGLKSKKKPDKEKKGGGPEETVFARSFFLALTSLS